jgi:hypothetical protein
MQTIVTKYRIEFTIIQYVFLMNFLKQFKASFLKRKYLTGREKWKSELVNMEGAWPSGLHCNLSYSGRRKRSRGSLFKTIQPKLDPHLNL